MTVRWNDGVITWQTAAHSLPSSRPSNCLRVFVRSLWASSTLCSMASASRRMKEPVIHCSCHAAQLCAVAQRLLKGSNSLMILPTCE
jgi:hypothetical protein